MDWELNDDQQLVSATVKGHNLRTYDDGFGPLWVVNGVYGPRMVVRAKSFEDAWDIFVDESKTVPQEELYEAYGFDSQEDFDKAVKAAEEGDGPDLNLADSYHYQSNSTGTGIVFVEYDTRIASLTPEYAARLDIELDIQDID
jgi:hypothetical protein